VKTVKKGVFDVEILCLSICQNFKIGDGHFPNLYWKTVFEMSLANLIVWAKKKKFG